MAHASTAINSLGLIENLQIAATGLEPGKKYRLVLVGNGESQDLVKLSVGIGGSGIVQTLVLVKRAVAVCLGGNAMRLELRSDETGDVVLHQTSE